MSGNIYSLPQLEPPRPDDITVALKLVMALGDTKGTAATLKRLAEATAAHMVLLAAGSSGGEPVSVHCAATPGQIGILWYLVCSKVDKTIVAMFDNQERAA